MQRAVYGLVIGLAQRPLLGERFAHRERWVWAVPISLAVQAALSQAAYRSGAPNWLLDSFVTVAGASVLALALHTMLVPEAQEPSQPSGQPSPPSPPQPP